MFGQLLAVLHGGVHGHARDRVAVGAVPVASALVKMAAGHDEGSLWCRVLDQLAHPSPVAVPLLVFAPQAVARAEPAAPAAVPRAAAFRSYRARGPPALT